MKRKTNKEMRRLWRVRLRHEYEPPITKETDDEKAVWTEMVAAHTASEAIILATVAVRRQSRAHGALVPKPFVVSVESFGAFDSDVL